MPGLSKIFTALLLTLLVSSCGEQPAALPSAAVPLNTPAPITPGVGAEPATTGLVSANPVKSRPAETKAEPGPNGSSPAIMVSHGGPVKDYVSLIDNLRKEGATINPLGEVNQLFFTVKGYLIRLNEQDVQVFEYADAGTTRAEAARVSPDGSTVGTSKVSWLAKPHFFQKERVVVLYIGDEALVLLILQRVLGPQFAGE